MYHFHLTRTKSKGHIPFQEAVSCSTPKPIACTFETQTSNTKFLRVTTEFYTERHKS